VQNAVSAAPHRIIARKDDGADQRPCRGCGRGTGYVICIVNTMERVEVPLCKVCKKKTLSYTDEARKAVLRVIRYVHMSWSYHNL
jgi:hypothetical protein